MASYSFNQHYFDQIDSSDKAYWIGFLWGDGYVSRRDRGSYISYELKVSLSEVDEQHLVNFKRDLESTHEIKKYKVTGFQTDNMEARLYISNKHMARILYEEYGIRPHRDDFSLIAQKVPSQFYRDLVRGLLDSDGGIAVKNVQHKKSLRKEFSLGLISNVSVLDFFNEQLMIQGLTQTSYKQVKRHEGRDGLVKNIRITGNNIVENILRWVYTDAEQHSLPRKYKLFREVVQYMDDYKRERSKL